MVLKNDNSFYRMEGHICVGPNLCNPFLSCPNAHVAVCTQFACRLRSVYVQITCSGLQVGVAISKNRKANLIAHKHTGGKRVGHLTSPPSPLAASLLCEVAVFLSHSVVVQRQSS